MGVKTEPVSEELSPFLGKGGKRSLKSDVDMERQLSDGKGNETDGLEGEFLEKLGLGGYRKAASRPDSWGNGRSGLREPRVGFMDGGVSREGAGNNPLGAQYCGVSSKQGKVKLKERNTLALESRDIHWKKMKKNPVPR